MSGYMSREMSRGEGRSPSSLMSCWWVYRLQSFRCGRRLPALNIRFRRSVRSVSHFIEREGLVRYRLEPRNRRRSVREVCTGRPVQFSKLQAQRRIARWAHPATRAITAEPGGKFVAPGRDILPLGVHGPGTLNLIVLSLTVLNQTNGRLRLSGRITLLQCSRKGLLGTTTNFSTQRTIHENQSLASEIIIAVFIEIVPHLCLQNRASSSGTYNRKATKGNPSPFRHFAARPAAC